METDFPSPEPDPPDWVKPISELEVRLRSNRSEMTEKGSLQTRPSSRRKAKWDGPTSIWVTRTDPKAPPANYWQGVFPAIDTGEDGYKARTAPVGCYPASAHGLFDMSGNVWEWTSGRYGQGAEAAQHVIKGGSFLCADNYCLRYRPAARQAGPPDTGSSHIGFRTVRRGSLAEKGATP